MLLTIDIGNTNIEFGLFKGSDIIGSFRLGTNHNVTSDEIGLFTAQFFPPRGKGHRNHLGCTAGHAFHCERGEKVFL